MKFGHKTPEPLTEIAPTTATLVVDADGLLDQFSDMVFDGAQGPSGSFHRVFGSVCFPP